MPKYDTFMDKIVAITQAGKLIENKE